MTDPKDSTIPDADDQDTETVGDIDIDDTDTDDGEEEEIFSNRPEGEDEEDDADLDDPVEEAYIARSDSADSDVDAEQDERDEEGERPEVRRPEVRMRPKNVEELLLEAVPQRARSAGEKLKLHLTGKTLISLKNSTDRYLLDWSGAEMITSKAASDDADCKITLSESDLMKISTGDLNPQILMLSHKVSVSGKADHAIYIFNLIAPHNSL